MITPKSRWADRSAPAIAAMCAVLLAGCTLQHGFRSPPMQTPAQWENGVAGKTDTDSFAVAQDGWWTALGDEAIDTLMSATLQDNPTLSVASERVEDAKSAAAVARAQQLPQINVSGSASRAKSQYPLSQGEPYTLMHDSASVGPSLGWEIDIWGRLRESARAARRRLDEQVADAQSARLSLEAQVADTVLSLRACRYSLSARNEDIVSRETELSLMRRRLAAGSAAQVDEANAITNLAAARTARIAVQEQCTQGVDALVALTGRDAAFVRAAVAAPLPKRAAGGLREPSPAGLTMEGVMPYAPALQPVMPATVLLAHPVVVAAEHEAAARWSDIGVARAQRLPQIDLTALLTGQWLRALGTSAHFDTWSAGASLAGPLFDGGAGAANVRGAEARYRQALANLRSVLRSTAQDIEDALAAQSAAEERTVTAAQELDAAQMTLHANEERWRVGAISMFELQIARRQLTNANEDSIAAVRDRAIAWVNLVRASNSTSPRADERGVGSLSSSHDTAAASTFTSSTW